jgi:high-affinity iron transporter
VSAASARQAGRQVFMRECAFCHGTRGDGHGVRASSFSTPPRDFTDASWRRSTSPRRVYRAIRDGIPGTAMPSWRMLGDQTLIDLTAYVLSIRP